MKCLYIVLKLDLITGMKLCMCKDVMAGKKFFILFIGEVRQCIRSRYQVVETAFFCFFDPFICITVSVEDDTFVFFDGLFE